MNNLMIAQISCTRQQENGEFKRVKEQYIIPGDTFSTAEDFVFKTLAEGVKGEFTLQGLKREPIDPSSLRASNKGILRLELPITSQK